MNSAMNSPRPGRWSPAQFSTGDSANLLQTWIEPYGAIGHYLSSGSAN